MKILFTLVVAVALIFISPAILMVLFAWVANDTHWYTYGYWTWFKMSIFLNVILYSNGRSSKSE